MSRTARHKKITTGSKYEVLYLYACAEQEYKEASKQKTCDTGITLVPNENNLFVWKALLKVCCAALTLCCTATGAIMHDYNLQGACIHEMSKHMVLACTASCHPQNRHSASHAHAHSAQHPSHAHLVMTCRALWTQRLRVGTLSWPSMCQSSTLWRLRPSAIGLGFSILTCTSRLVAVSMHLHMQHTCKGYSSIRWQAASCKLHGFMHATKYPTGRTMNTLSM